MIVDEFKSKAKETIEKKEAGWKWRIRVFPIEPYTICLDDGDNSLNKLELDKNLYSIEEVKELASKIAKDLGLEYQA